MGLDIYAGPVTRYVAGDWMTIVQQVGHTSGFSVDVARPNEPKDAIRDLSVVGEVVARWQAELLQTLDADGGTWTDGPDVLYATDRPDWDGYGAVVLLAASSERPELAPGSLARKGRRRRAVEPVMPRQFSDSEVFKAAAASPKMFPLLLHGAEWCLPLSSGPAVFRTPTPNGTALTMGRVDALVAELNRLNEHTLRLSPADLVSARSAGPPADASVDEVAPFGLAVLLALAEFSAVNSVAWILDY